MIPNDDAIIIYKFGENQWIEKILQGEISFSCAGAFINQAKRTGNFVQGDELEGIFARLQKNNPYADTIREKIGTDLEEIIDGEYIFFRRRSAKFKPIFCVFAYTAEDLIKDGQPQKSGRHRIRVDFDNRLFDGFASLSVQNVLTPAHRFTMLLLQPKPFMDKIKLALQNISYRVRKVDYIDMHNKEFYIEPTEDYPELFVKSNDYEYQHEARICLTSEKLYTTTDRYPLHISSLSKKDYEVTHSAIYTEFTVIFEKRDAEQDSSLPIHILS